MHCLQSTLPSLFASAPSSVMLRYSVFCLCSPRCTVAHCSISRVYSSHRTEAAPLSFCHLYSWALLVPYHRLSTLHVPHHCLQVIHPFSVTAKVCNCSHPHHSSPLT
ncbi:hypothetical protein SESBI_46120 [Sesbania bispinosa]|nr:hypothetical protein SESBI_46120 [Sesbania bispinosa]